MAKVASGEEAMSVTPCLAKPLSLRSFSLRAALLGLGLVAAAGPAAAGGKPTSCVLGSKASPTEVIAACTYIIDNDAASRKARAAALVARADARANTSGGMSQALADLDGAIALDSKNGTAFRLRGDMTREAGGNLAPGGGGFEHRDRARSQGCRSL
jgi:hypothetical protein